MAFKAGAIYGEARLNTKNWDSGLTRISKGAAIAGAAIGAAFVLGMVKATKAANEFQKEIANVSTLIDTAAIDMQKLSKEVLQLSPALGGATEVTKGLYQAFSAGAETAEEAMKITTDSAIFAKAALTNTFTAVDVLTTAVNAYGKEVMDTTKASDIFFQTIKYGKVTGEELGAAIGTSIPLYASAGIALKELAAGMAAMTKQGVKANVSTTQLNAIINMFLKPSADMIAALDEMEYASGSAFLKAEGLAGALKLIEERTKGDAAEMAKLLPNIRALRGAMALTGVGGEEFTRVLDEMGNASGVTKEAFDKQEKTFETFKSAMGRVQIVIGEVGRLMAVDLAEGATKAATWFVNLDEGALNIIKSLFKGTIIIAGVTAGVIALSIAIGALSTAFAFLAANPVVAVIAGIAALSIGIVALIELRTEKHIEELTEKFGELAESTGVAEDKVIQFVEAAEMIEMALARNWSASFEDISYQVSELSKNTGLTREQIVKIGIASDYINDSMKSGLVIMEKQIDKEKEVRQEAENMLELRKEGARIRRIALTSVVEKEREEQEKILVLIEEQLRLEKERITGVIKDRKTAVETYTKALEESAIKINLGLIDEQENLRNNIAAAEIFVDSLIAIGYDGADAIQIGNQQLLETMDTLKDLRGELEEVSVPLQIHGDLFRYMADTTDTYVANTRSDVEDLKVTWQDYFDSISGGMLYFYDSLSSIASQYRTNQSAELELSYQSDLAALDLKLQNEIMTQEEYDAAKAELDEDFKNKKNELAEKVFEADKKNRMLGVFSDAASSIMGWWAAAPRLGPIAGPIFAGFMTGLTGVTAGIQASLIAKQKFVPAMAEGGTTSGLTRINERGGEILNLPGGTIVIPNDISREIARAGGSSGPTINISFAGAKISNDMDLDYVTNVVIKKLGREMRLAL